MSRFDRWYQLAYRRVYPLATIWWRLRGHPGTCVAVWLGERVLAVQHSYKPGLRIPRGGVKSGEPFDLATVRELREETGVVIEPINLTLIMMVKTPYGPMAFYETFLAEEPDLVVDHREIIYAGFHRPEELYESDGDVGRYIRSRWG